MGETLVQVEVGWPQTLAGDHDKPFCFTSVEAILELSFVTESATASLIQVSTAVLCSLAAPVSKACFSGNRNSEGQSFVMVGAQSMIAN